MKGIQSGHLPVGSVVNCPNFTEEDKRGLLSIIEVAFFKTTKPRQIGFSKKVMEEKAGRERIGVTAGLKCRRREMRFSQKAAHTTDARSLGFGEVCVVKHIGGPGRARNTAVGVRAIRLAERGETGYDGRVFQPA